MRENVWRLGPELSQQKNWLLHHDTSCFPGIFYQKQHGCHSPPAQLIIIFISMKSNTILDVEKSVQNKQYREQSQYSYNSKIEASK
jgi:hypothetical protein